MEKNEHDRLDLATEQLEVAVELFLSKRSFVSALTLAGAAEEVLGKALNHKGQKNWRQKEFDLVALPERASGRQYDWKKFIEETNKTRNAAKHFRHSQESIIASDTENDSLQMIVRAILNYRDLDLPRKTFIQTFHTWFYDNVVGSEHDY
jgi:hypothetical protein